MRKASALLLLIVCGCGVPEARPPERDCAFHEQLKKIRSNDTTTERIALLVCRSTADEPINDRLPVHVALANVSDDNVEIRPSLVFGAWLNASILGPDGRLLPQVEHIDPPRPSLLSLAPGDMVDTTLDLLCPLWTGEPHVGCVRPYVLERSGTYEIAMRYTYRCDDGPCPDGASERHTVYATPFTVLIEQ